MEGERCQRCHELYDFVWYAPDELWERVTGITDGSGLFCPGCFDLMAAEKGIMLYWECAEGAFPTLFREGG